MLKNFICDFSNCPDAEELALLGLVSLIFGLIGMVVAFASGYAWK